MVSGNKLRVYIAAPLFSAAEREFNRYLKKLLENFFEIWLPQEDGGLLENLIASGVPVLEAKRRIRRIDLEAIARCDILIAILDGRTVDDGVVVELVRAHVLGKTCVGLQTDPRRLLPSGNNLMLEGELEQIFPSIEALTEWARETYDAPRPIIA